MRKSMHYKSVVNVCTFTAPCIKNALKHRWAAADSHPYEVCADSLHMRLCPGCHGICQERSIHFADKLNATGWQALVSDQTELFGDYWCFLLLASGPLTQAESARAELQGSVPYQGLDLALGVAIPVHSHIAINSVVSDYVPKSFKGKLSMRMLRTADSIHSKACFL